MGESESKYSVSFCTFSAHKSKPHSAQPHKYFAICKINIDNSIWSKSPAAGEMEMKSTCFIHMPEPNEHEGGIETSNRNDDNFVCV